MGRSTASPSSSYSLRRLRSAGLPEFKEDADENWRRHRYWSGADQWDHEPSWYMDHHFHWGFQVDRFGLKVRHDIGVDRIQWSTDFPHVQCDWPESRRVIEEQFADIPAEETRKIVCENAVRYFRLSEWACYLT